MSMQPHMLDDIDYAKEAFSQFRSLHTLENRTLQEAFWWGYLYAREAIRNGTATNPYRKGLYPASEPQTAPVLPEPGADGGT